MLLFNAGDKFISKQVDSKKKKKLRKVEEKILGWGIVLFRVYISLESSKLMSVWMHEVFRCCLRPSTYNA